MCMYKPPSAIIKEEFYKSLKENKELSESWLQEVAQKTLLTFGELNMHVDHLRATAKRRKEGAKKAALTRKAKKGDGNKKAEGDNKGKEHEGNKKGKKSVKKVTGKYCSKVITRRRCWSSVGCGPFL